MQQVRNEVLTMPETVSRTRPVQMESGRLMQLTPHISSTALFMKVRTIENGTGDLIAATDSTSLFLWPAFFLNYDKPERTFILLHEYAHSAYAHPQRGGILRRRLGEKYNDNAFGVACDGVVNSGIMGDPMMRNERDIKVPKDLITLPGLYERAVAIVKVSGRNDIPIDRMKEISKLSVETLYAILMELKSAAEECRRGGDGDDGEGGESDGGSGKTGKSGAPEDPQDGDAGGQPEAGPVDKNQEMIDEFLSMMQRPSDLMNEAVSRMSPQQLDDIIRQAGDRLRSARTMHGTRSGSMIEMLAGDIPEVVTPWENTFRSVTQRHLARDRVKNNRRPGRRVMTQEAMGSRNIVWHPARKRLPVPLVVVITDSSGSVDATEYLRYLSEIQAMKKRTQARVISIVADVDVQSVEEIETVRDLQKIEFKGRGGTDFRPALKLADEMDPDLIIYLTDLGGTFPNKAPDTPVIWAVCSDYGASNDSVPFGRVINLV